MKTHVKHITVGGIVAPLALFLATIIANEGQTLLGLHLSQTALAVYLVPFLLGAAAILHGQLRVEAANIANDLDLGKMLGDLGGLFGGAPAPAKPLSSSPPKAPSVPLPSPPPAP